MDIYNELTRDQLIERLLIAEKQLDNVSIGLANPHESKHIETQDNIPIAYVGADRTVFHVNKALCDINGFDSTDIIGHYLGEFEMNLDYNWDTELFAEMLSGKSDVFRAEHGFVLKDGSKVFFDVIVMAVRDMKGKFLYAYYVFNDIRSSKHNEMMLADMLDSQSRIAKMLMLMLQKEAGGYENDILKIVLERYNADRAYIFKFNWENNTSSNLHEVTANGIASEIHNLQHLPNNVIKHTFKFLEANNPYIVNHLDELNESLSEPRKVLADQGIQSMVIFPVYILGKLWGYLGIDMVNSQRIWLDKDIDWLRSFTDILSIGLSHKFTQDELIQQKKTFDMILDSGSLGYWQLDSKTMRLDFMNSYLTMLGYSSGELNHSFSAFEQLIHADDRFKLEIFKEDVLNNANKEWSAEFQIRTRSGDWRWVMSKILNIEYDPYTDSTIITGINLDINETKQAYRKIKENLLRLSLVMESGDMIPWYFDINTGKIEIENKFHKVYNKKIINIENYNLYLFRESLHPDDAVKIQHDYELLQSGELVKIDLELRINLFGEGYVWCELSAAVRERSENGDIIQLLGFIAIIQDRKDTEKNLIEAMERAEESDRLKSAFLANVSHEIRTPLNAIVGFSELIANSDDEQEKKSFLDIVKTNNNLLLNLINDILDLSRIESGRVDLKESMIDIKELCGELCDIHQMKICNGVKIIFDPLNSDPLTMLTDRNRLHQIYSNLINNALKNTLQGSVTIGYHRNGDQVVFSVKDTGVGMPPEKVDSIFKRFEKLDSNAQGFGLGLSICKSILERMDGVINVKSELGVGSEFIFMLPYINMPGVKTEVYKPVKSDAIINAEVKKEKKILIAEDIDCNYLLLKAILGKRYILTRAITGLEAIAGFKQERPDIILMDLKMPEMDGIEATTQIRILSKDIPIIAVSAFAFDSDVQKALSVGCNDFIPKPVDSEKLVSLIEKLTNN